MNIYIARGLTGLGLSHPEFANCFVFTIFASKAGADPYQSMPTFYVFCPPQDPPLDTGAILSALRNPNSVPDGTLSRTLPNGGEITGNSFQSNVDINSLDGSYDLRQVGTNIISVQVGFRSLGRGLRPRNPLPRSVANILQVFLQWWLRLLPDSSYGDMRVNVDPDDIHGATSLSGSVIRLDSPQNWMIHMAQSGAHLARSDTARSPFPPTLTVRTEEASKLPRQVRPGS